MRLLITIFTILLSYQAFAEIKTEEVMYKADVPLKGFIAYPEDPDGDTPAILVVHEWWGHNEHTRQTAIEFAKAGFIAFALDMYGQGKSTTHPKEAKEFMQAATKNQTTANKRFQAALDILKKNPKVDESKIGAVGYCFGGKVVLDQARQNTDLMGVVSIHGAISPGNIDTSRHIRVPVLVLHGEDDPMVSDETLVAFAKEMATHKATFDFIAYPKTKHAFTNPNATELGKKHDLPLEYNEPAAKDAQKRTIEFFHTQAKK